MTCRHPFEIAFAEMTKPVCRECGATVDLFGACGGNEGNDHYLICGACFFVDEEFIATKDLTKIWNA